MSKQPKTRQWPHKVRPVRVTDMRVPTADVCQRRYSRSQAEEYAANFDLNKFGIPAVNFREAIYWLIDGQHRIAALKLWFAPNDPGEVTCNVYEGLSDAEMAELFDGLNTRRAVNPFTRFAVRCTAGRERETDILRTVEAQGLKIGRHQEEGAIGAVTSLCRVYDRSGAVVLGQTLRTLKMAFLGDPAAFDRDVIEGVSLAFNRYDGKIAEKDLAARLSKMTRGVHQLLTKAEALRERTGNLKTQCVASAVVDLYNKGRNANDGHRLPVWWKEA